jgi:hypothetical protein
MDFEYTYSVNEVRFVNKKLENVGKFLILYRNDKLSQHISRYKNSAETDNNKTLMIATNFYNLCLVVNNK